MDSLADFDLVQRHSWKIQKIYTLIEGAVCLITTKYFKDAMFT